MSADFLSATKFINREIKPVIKRCSSTTGEGIDDVWKAITSFSDNQLWIQSKREQQRIKLLKTYLVNTILQRIDEKVNINYYESLLQNNNDLLIWDIIDEILSKINI